MAMSWTILTGPKTTNGSLASWVNYTKLDAVTIVAEAESLLYSMLRVREMRDEWIFGMAVGQSEIALPSRFLDPIGKLRDITNGISLGHKIETDISNVRAYDNQSGDFGADPFTTETGSDLVLVHQPSHGLTQGTIITIAGAAGVGGLTMNGTFPIVSVVDQDNFIVDVSNDATASDIGGGAAASFTAERLIPSCPMAWSIWQESMKFDAAFDTATSFKLLYYRSPKPLSAANETNWLTNRYPMLMRKACVTAAADFMKDDAEYTKNLTALSALVQSTAAENDMIYRGSDLETETP